MDEAQDTALAITAALKDVVNHGCVSLDEALSETSVPFDSATLVAMLNDLRAARDSLRILDDTIVALIFRAVGRTPQKGKEIAGVRVVVSRDTERPWVRDETFRTVGIALAEGDIEEGERIAKILDGCFTANPGFAVTGLQNLGADTDALRPEKIEGKPRVRIV